MLEVIRSFRIGPFSVFDFSTAYLGIYLVAPYLSLLLLKIGLVVSRASWLWLTLPIAVVVHLLLGLQTPLMKLLVNPSGDYLVKLIFLIMLIMGFKGLRLKG